MNITPTALDIARTELNAAEEDLNRLRRPSFRDKTNADLDAYRAACDAVITARKGYAAAFWAERDGGAE